jgi:2-amino-4-hydroxy-6-hydroxymethyldihydropteridine diphosphokinase
MLVEMNRTFLSLGSNLGDSRSYLQKAVELIGRNTAINQITGISPVYRTKAWGKTDQPDFLNMVMELNTKGSPEMLIREILEIEKMMGRIRAEKWGERIIDIDILLYGNKIVKAENLVVPHPEMHKRKFVLVPLMDLDPNVIHPLFKKNISQLLDVCEDESPVIAAGNLFE